MQPFPVTNVASTAGATQVTVRERSSSGPDTRDDFFPSLLEQSCWGSPKTLLNTGFGDSGSRHPSTDDNCFPIDDDLMLAGNTESNDNTKMVAGARLIDDNGCTDEWSNCPSSTVSNSTSSLSTPPSSTSQTFIGSQWNQASGMAAAAMTANNNPFNAGLPSMTGNGLSNAHPMCPSFPAPPPHHQSNTAGMAGNPFVHHTNGVGFAAPPPMYGHSRMTMAPMPHHSMLSHHQTLPPPPHHLMAHGLLGGFGAPAQSSMYPPSMAPMSPWHTSPAAAAAAASAVAVAGLGLPRIAAFAMAPNSGANSTNNNNNSSGSNSSSGGGGNSSGSNSSGSGSASGSGNGGSSPFFANIVDSFVNRFCANLMPSKKDVIWTEEDEATYTTNEELMDVTKLHEKLKKHEKMNQEREEEQRRKLAQMKAAERLEKEKEKLRQHQQRRMAAAAAAAAAVVSVAGSSGNNAPNVSGTDRGRYLQPPSILTEKPLAPLVSSDSTISNQNKESSAVMDHPESDHVKQGTKSTIQENQAYQMQSSSVVKTEPSEKVKEQNKGNNQTERQNQPRGQLKEEINDKAQQTSGKKRRLSESCGTDSNTDEDQDRIDDNQNVHGSADEVKAGYYPKKRLKSSTELSSGDV